MTATTTHRLLKAGLLVPAIVTALGGSAAAQNNVPTRVFLNGVPTPVYFNDGDSFRVLGGRHYGTRARLAGFNTLESYGPVHQWGGWKAKELYHLAKLATYNARAGVWHCESEDFATDTYGRILWDCKDLAVDQVRRGLAHAMTVTLDPADPDVLAAQAEAIRERRGMWAHGVPEYVLTSLHSTAEGGGYDGRTYNRMVSTRDGHSVKWRHDDAYEECAKICSTESEVDPASIDAVLAALQADPGASSAAASLERPRLRNVVGDFLRLGFFSGVKDEAVERELLDGMQRATESGIPVGIPKEGACVVYVEFERRYGSGRAACLK